MPSIFSNPIEAEVVRVTSKVKEGLLSLIVLLFPRTQDYDENERRKIYHGVFWYEMVSK